ncbi:glycosyltransferase family 2 protein [Candidatus Woesebacteria bacterium]|nr:glycosyltransferase family 2 protein [Candidatus Woesebacteria bacterium]
MATVAIILINYNSTRLTKKCVKSLFSTKEDQDTYHVVIWDNASKQAPTPEDFPDCKLVLSPTNDGFAKGNNLAVKTALKTQNPDYLLILNNDTRVTKGMIRQLITTYQSASDIGIVLPKIYFEKGYEFHQKDYDHSKLGKILWFAGGGIDWRNAILFHKGADEVDRGQFDLDTSSHVLQQHKDSLGQKIERLLFEDTVLPEPIGGQATKATSYDSHFATGCCFLITPALWKKLQGFDEKYFMYYEDADFSLRLKKLRKRIVFEPQSSLYHLNAGSSGGSGSTLHLYYQTRNRLRFGLKYASLKTKLLLLLEARRQFSQGTEAVKLGILHALEGRWGNQTKYIPQHRHFQQS